MGILFRSNHTILQQMIDRQIFSPDRETSRREELQGSISTFTYPQVSGTGETPPYSYEYDLLSHYKWDNTTTMRKGVLNPCRHDANGDLNSRN